MCWYVIVSSEGLFGCCEGGKDPGPLRPIAWKGAVLASISEPSKGFNVVVLVLLSSDSSRTTVWRLWSYRVLLSVQRRRGASCVGQRRWALENWVLDEDRAPTVL